MGPLADVVVVDLTQMLAGPFTTQLLADLGADVIKVEPPQGDETRRAGPYRADDELRAHGGYFQSVNRNKRSVAVDLKTAAGRDVVLRLVDHADVLVENFRAGVMDRLGLAYERLAERNPRLVYTAVRGFGDPRTGSSPYLDWPAFDIVAQAMGGLVGINGPDRTSPTKVGVGIGDLFPGALAAVGVLAALHDARRTGRGQFVDVAMYDSVLALCERIVYQYSYSGVVPAPEGNGHPLLCPFDVLPAADGWVTIACPLDHHWRELCKVIGRPDLADDPGYATNAARAERRHAVRRVLESWTADRTRAEILAVLGGVVPAGPVNTVADIYADPHVAAREMLVPLEQPGSAEPVTVAGVPIKMTRTPGAVHRRAPLLGEDTQRILAGAGFPAAEIAALYRAGVVA